MNEQDTQSSGTASPSGALLLGAIAAGACLGGAVGLLTGLAASPTVGTVTGALVGIASGGATLKQPALSLSFLGGFAVLLACGALTGIHVRSHNLLSPTPAELVHRWTSAGMDRVVAQQFAAAAFGYELDVEQVAVEPTSPQRAEGEQAKAPAPAYTEPAEGDPGAKKPDASTRTPKPGPDPAKRTVTTKTIVKPLEDKHTLTASLLFSGDSAACDELINKLERDEEVPLEAVQDRMRDLGPPWSTIQASNRGALLQKVRRQCDD